MAGNSSVWKPIFHAKKAKASMVFLPEDEWTTVRMND